MATDSRHPILIVDDEPDVLFSLKGLLRHEFELHTAESGDAALEILNEHDVHVIVTDQRMPGMTGVELMEKARVQFPAAVRIIFTGYADIKAVVDAINTGGLYRYVTKPWDPDDLIKTLHDAAERYERQIDLQQFASDVRSFAARVRDALTEGDTRNSQELAAQSLTLAEEALRLFPQA